MYISLAPVSACVNGGHEQTAHIRTTKSLFYSIAYRIDLTIAHSYFHPTTIGIKQPGNQKVLQAVLV